MAMILKKAPRVRLQEHMKELSRPTLKPGTHMNKLVTGLVLKYITADQYKRGELEKSLITKIVKPFNQLTAKIKKDKALSEESKKKLLSEIHYRRDTAVLRFNIWTSTLPLEKPLVGELDMVLAVAPIGLIRQISNARTYEELASYAIRLGAAELSRGNIVKLGTRSLEVLTTGIDDALRFVSARDAVRLSRISLHGLMNGSTSLKTFAFEETDTVLESIFRKWLPDTMRMNEMTALNRSVFEAEMRAGIAHCHSMFRGQFAEIPERIITEFGRYFKVASKFGARPRPR